MRMRVETGNCFYYRHFSNALLSAETVNRYTIRVRQIRPRAACSMHNWTGQYKYSALGPTCYGTCFSAQILKIQRKLTPFPCPARCTTSWLWLPWPPWRPCAASCPAPPGGGRPPSAQCRRWTWRRGPRSSAGPRGQVRSPGGIPVGMVLVILFIFF